MYRNKIAVIWVKKNKSDGGEPGMMNFDTEVERGLVQVLSCVHEGEGQDEKAHCVVHIWKK